MTSDRFMFSQPLFAGTLLRRYKRFFADIALESGTEVTAHCPNTGPMTGVCEVGSPVHVSHHTDPKRKLAYTWEMIQIQGTWVGINTNMPNRVVEHGLRHQWFPELAGFQQLRREVPYGSQRSKIDLLLTYSNDQLAYVEVKNTTWSSQSCALFPDTVTTRGQKHLQELMEMVDQQHRAIMIYFIHRSDCTEFSPGDAKDPTYGSLLREAVAQGVEVYPYRFATGPEGIQPLGLASLVI